MNNLHPTGSEEKQLCFSAKRQRRIALQQDLTNAFAKERSPWFADLENIVATLPQFADEHCLLRRLPSSFRPLQRHKVAVGKCTQ